MTTFETKPLGQRALINSRMGLSIGKAPPTLRLKLKEVHCVINLTVVSDYYHDGHFLSSVESNVHL